MDVFSIDGIKTIRLTREAFEKETFKEFPYYQINKKGEQIHFAICPECGNVIQIINLYGKQYVQKRTKCKAMHAKHFIHNANGFLEPDKQKYDNCTLANPSAFGIDRIRDDEEYNDYLREIIETNMEQIKKDLLPIIGINLSSRVRDGLWEIFMNSRAYRYQATNKFNIPYAILYTSRAISIYKQYIRNDELGEKIMEAINKKSQYFIVKENKQINKKHSGSGFVKINLIVIEHVIQENKQTMKLVITEEAENGNIQIIYDKKIKLVPFIY